MNAIGAVRNDGSASITGSSIAGNDASYNIDRRRADLRLGTGNVPPMGVLALSTPFASWGLQGGTSSSSL